MDYLQVWLRQGVVPVALITTLAVSGLAGAVTNFLTLSGGPYHLFFQEIPGKKFLTIAPDAYKNFKDSEILFLSDQTEYAYRRDLYQAQNVFAPKVVKTTGEAELIIAIGTNPSSVIRWQEVHNAHIIARDQTVYLLQKNEY